MSSNTSESTLVVRRSPWALLPLFLFLFGACLFLVGMEFKTRAYVAGVLAAINGLIALLVGQRILALRQPTNWVLRLAPPNLIVNCSPLGKDDVAPLSIPLKSIASARRLNVQTERPDDDGKVYEKHVFLELTLTRIDTAPLKTAGSPIYVDDAHCFRIAWRDRTTWLTPSLDSLLDALSQYTSVKPADASQWAPSEQLDDAAFENRIRELCAGGEMISAIALMRKRYGLSLTEAKQRIEALLPPK